MDSSMNPFWMAAAAAAVSTSTQGQKRGSHDDLASLPKDTPSSLFTGNLLLRNYTTSDISPDIIVNVGGKIFPSYKTKLSQQSLYFKSALDKSSTGSATTNGQTNANNINNIDLPSIPHEYFSILLAGIHANGNYVPLLNAENVYQVLLYAQLLQIPTAIAQCREFLADLYLMERRSSNPQLPVASMITPFGMKLPANDNSYNLTSHRSANELYDAFKIVKPIPSKIIREPSSSQAVNDAVRSNWISPGELDDVWKPWIQQYQQRLRLPSTLPDYYHSPLSLIGGEEKKRCFTSHLAGLFEKPRKNVNEDGKESNISLSAFRESLKDTSNPFTQPLKVSGPYLAAAAKASAINYSSKLNPTSPIGTSIAPTKSSEKSLFSTNSKVLNEVTHEDGSLNKDTLAQEKSVDGGGKVSALRLLSKTHSMKSIPDQIQRDIGERDKGDNDDANYSFFRFQNLFQENAFHSFKRIHKSITLPNAFPSSIGLPDLKKLQRPSEKSGAIMNRSLHHTTSEKQSKDEYTDEKIPETIFSHLDVAACDGPVRFHKVLNTINSKEEIAKMQLKKDNRLKQDIGENAHKQQDYNEEDDRNYYESSERSNENNISGEIYECPYCSHIFKSHYCYQKHKRRHINPFTADFCTNKFGSSTSTIRRSSAVESVENSPRMQSKTHHSTPNVLSYMKEDTCSKRGEGVGGKTNILKDINVQFFPCKICGAKFPSYYFVHKHKKMWHADELMSQEEPSEEVLEQLSNESKDTTDEKPDNICYANMMQKSFERDGFFGGAGRRVKISKDPLDHGSRKPSNLSSRQNKQRAPLSDEDISGEISQHPLNKKIKISE